MATMYELTADYMTVLAMATDGETDPECIADTLEAIGGEIEEKAEATAKVLLSILGEKDLITAEIDRLKAREKSLENNAKAIKDRLYNAMKVTGKEKFKTPLFSFSIRKNPAKLVIDDEKLVPAIYLVEQPPKIDSARLKEYLKENNITCNYAHIEQGESLSIR